MLSFALSHILPEHVVHHKILSRHKASDFARQVSEQMNRTSENQLCTPDILVRGLRMPDKDVRGTKHLFDYVERDQNIILTRTQATLHLKIGFHLHKPIHLFCG